MNALRDFFLFVLFSIILAVPAQAVNQGVTFKSPIYCVASDTRGPNALVGLKDGTVFAVRANGASRRLGQNSYAVGTLIPLRDRVIAIDVAGHAVQYRRDGQGLAGPTLLMVYPNDAVALGPSGLLTGDISGRLKRWDLDTGEVVSIIDAHSAAISDLDVSPDRRHVSSASFDGKVKVWDAQSWELLQTFQMSNFPYWVRAAIWIDKRHVGIVGYGHDSLIVNALTGEKAADIWSPDPAEWALKANRRGIVLGVMNLAVVHYPTRRPLRTPVTRLTDRPTVRPAIIGNKLALPVGSTLSFTWFRR